MYNLHTPQRLENESFTDYKQRRAHSNVVVKRLLRGTPSTSGVNLYKQQRRRLIKECGGIRQYKKMRRRS